MKYTTPFIFLILQTVSILNFAQNEWIRFNADEEFSFSVDVPGEMKKSTKTIKTAVGDLNVITYAFQGIEEDPNYLYLINLVQYPEGTFPIDSMDLMDDYLQNAIQTSAENVAGELVYANKLDKEMGMLFRIKYNDGNAIIKGKSYIKNDVFISLQVFTIQSKSLNDEMNYFLDSFRVKF